MRGMVVGEGGRSSGVLLYLPRLTLSSSTRVSEGTNALCRQIVFYLQIDLIAL